MEDKINAYKVLVGGLKRRLGRPKYRCEANSKMDIEEIRWEGMD
jgi:molybdopterin-guanine dinucleotide biosynthesis protein A